MNNVSIIMGSDSDLHIMKDAIEILEALDIFCEVRIISAHRTPDLLHEYIQTLEKKNISVIIAGAGGAAHLAGVIAGITSLPVIAVPIYQQAFTGLDSLLSMVQMPPGVPVATVGVNAAKNAGILASQILAISDSDLKEKVKSYKANMAKVVKEKNDRIIEIGWKEYLDKK